VTENGSITQFWETRYFGPGGKASPGDLTNADSPDATATHFILQSPASTPPGSLKVSCRATDYTFTAADVAAAGAATRPTPSTSAKVCGPAPEHNSAEAVARCVYLAWVATRPGAAKNYATPEAIKRLFGFLQGSKARPRDFTLAGCAPTGNDDPVIGPTVRCEYDYHGPADSGFANPAVILGVRSGPSLGSLVTEAEFSTGD